MFVHKLQNIKIDLSRLKKELKEIVVKYPFTEINQLCLTTTRDQGGSVYEDIGSFFHKTNMNHEYVISEFRGGYFNEILGQIKNAFDGHVGRVRLMRLSPKKCYSMHVDSGPRLHIAIETNPSCFIVFLKQEMSSSQPSELTTLESDHVFIPTDGHIYFVNTSRSHTSVNAGETDRLHLVFSTL